MTTTTKATKPRNLDRNLGYGGGSLGWDAKRRQVTLQHVIDGHRHRERAATVAEAIAARDDRRQRAGVVASALDVTPSGTATVAELLTDWRRFVVGGKAPMTVKGYDWSIRIVSERLGALPCVSLTSGKVERLLLDLVAGGEGLTHESLNKLRSHLSMACRFGAKHGYLVANPVAAADTPGGTAPARPKRWLDAEEYASLRRHVATEHSTAATAVAVMLLTGLRPAEALGLRWEAIDLDRGVLHVRSAYRHGESGGSVVNELKTDRHGPAGHRTIPLAPDLVAILRRERRGQLARRASEYVLADERGEHFSSGWIRANAPRVARAAGVRPINPNACRHSFASMLVHNGMPLTLVAKLLGHTNLDQLSRTYGHAMTQFPDPTPFLGAPVTVAMA